MATLRQAQTRAKSLTPQKVTDDFFKFIRTLEEELVELNRVALNQRSQDVFGNPVGFYSPATEYISLNNALLGKGNKIKRAGDPFDLEETGTFLKSIFAKVDQHSVLFGNTDPKLLEVLSNTLTDDLFGLQDAELSKVINQKIKPYLIDYYKEQLLGAS